MNGFGRKRKSRNIDVDHSKVCFKPCGIRACDLETVIVYKE